MKNKFWKAFILFVFLALFGLATWFMYTRYTLKSPYYDPVEPVERTH